MPNRLAKGAKIFIGLLLSPFLLGAVVLADMVLIEPNWVSVERVRILHMVRMKTTKPTAITGLATILKRDRKSVSGDVKILESLGLLRTHDQSNPGHGTMKVVEPLAKKYHLAATI